MRAVSDDGFDPQRRRYSDDAAARISALLKVDLKQAALFPLAVDGDAGGAILRTIGAHHDGSTRILSDMRSRDRARNYAFPVNAQRS
jgi:predicted amino acid dehydrogenase